MNVPRRLSCLKAIVQSAINWPKLSAQCASMSFTAEGNFSANFCQSLNQKKRIIFPLMEDFIINWTQIINQNLHFVLLQGMSKEALECAQGRLQNSEEIAIQGRYIQNFSNLTRYIYIYTYRIVASRSTSRLVTCLGLQHPLLLHKT